MRSISRGSGGRLWYVAVINKEMLVRLVERLLDCAEGVEVEGNRVILRRGSGLEVVVRGEFERDIVDYVVMPSRRVIFTTEFGRVSNGVDIEEVPRDEPVYVVFLNNMRIPPTFWCFDQEINPLACAGGTMVVENDGRRVRVPVVIEGGVSGSYGIFQWSEGWI